MTTTFLNTQTILGGVFLIFLLLYIKSCRRQSLPPGPKGLPFIGNVLQIPQEKEWLTYLQWSKTYGDVLHLSIFGRSLVILNSWKTVNDLLDKRSAIYSDRPRLVMAGELLGYDQSIPLGHYNERHRESRKILHQMLGPRQVTQFHHIEERETTAFLSKLLDTPEKFRDHIRNMVGSMILQVAYGYRPQSEDDHLVNIVNRAMEDFALASHPGSFAVDFIPWLKYVPSWFPGAGFQSQAKIWRQHVDDMKDIPYKMVKKQIASGNYTFSFASHLLDSKSEIPPDVEDMYKWVITGVYGGGADTTVSAIAAFFLTMVLNPDVQKKAQDELDSVVGPNRLPTFSDRDKLLYVEGLLKEVLRWHPVGPCGLPHRVVQDDVYEGHTIPASAIIIANAWALLHDPTVYPNPDKFDPDRYLQSGTKENPDLNRDPRAAAFGFGRRSCPGMHLADTTLWASIAFTLSTFNITKAVDEAGVEITPTAEFTSSVICHPKPFACQIKPRSPLAESLVRHAVI
ncbi:cytochrome P450 [Rickenella mellea]|uniref:Cytochrome P450 n=1 Tax=Rickenella mellea TaxID=50990 RepID=A0A4Y7QF98_9AGAM|nr:cytochrome P450 [Rickenella mellea]